MKFCNLKYLFIFTSLIYLLASCTSENTPKAKKGKIDLSNVNFDNGKICNLDGDGWEFYWQKLLYVSDFYTQNLQPDAFITVPGPWTNAKLQKNKVDTYGFATYRLKVKLPKNSKQIGLFIPKIWCAANVWLDDSLMHQVGRVAKTYENYENEILEKLISFFPKNDELTLTIQIANHDLFVSGLMQSFEIGNYEYLMERKSMQYSQTVMWLGALFIMSLYHFVLYFYRRRNKAPLFVGLICLLIGIRLLVFGDHYLYEYLKIHGDFSYSIQSRIYYMTTFLLVPITFYYVQALYPNKIKNIFIKIAGIYVITFCFLALIIPPHYFSPFIPPLQGIAFAFLIYPIAGIIRAALKKRKDSSLQVIGISVMILAGINDALHTIGIETLGTFELLPFAFGVFLCLQFLIIARRFSRAFNEVEDLNQNLENKVKLRTQELNEKNLQLEESNHELEAVNNQLGKTNQSLEVAYNQITSSVKYASRIQNAVLGDPNEILQNFKDGFILFCPRDIVSGDFYWYDTINQEGVDYKILVTADATGHGVPGAFMTLLGSNFLEEIVNDYHCTEPDRILAELDNKIHKVLHKQSSSTVNDGMDLTIMVVDEENGKLYFSGAKNALCLVRDNELNEYKGSLFPIGGNSQFDKGKFFTKQVIDIQEGDVFYTFSDGFQDQFGGKKDRKYMKKRFKRLLASISYLPMQEQKEYLQKELEDWKGTQKQTDDIIVVGVKIL